MAGGVHSWSSSSVAKKLEKAQFNKTYTVDHYRTADDAFKSVLKADRNNINGYGGEKLIWEDLLQVHFEQSQNIMHSIFRYVCR